MPDAAGGRWRFVPDHAHATLGAGASRRFVFEATGRVDLRRDVRTPPTIAVDADYLGTDRRYAIPTRNLAIPVHFKSSDPGE
ncbi:MAG: hypothetical protein GY895_08100 [Phycisphaera sp.]|nr:hypothetical protein [Phycisphaera sp.]